MTERGETMGKARDKRFFLSSTDEAWSFGGFCARDRELELFIERKFEISRKQVQEEYDTDKRGIHIAQMIYLAEALLTCNKINGEAGE